MAKVIKKKPGRPALAKKPVKVVNKKVSAKTTAKKAPVKKVSKAASKRGRPALSTKNAKESKVDKGKMSNIVIDLSYGDCLNFFGLMLTRLNDIYDYITEAKKQEGCQENKCEKGKVSDEETSNLCEQEDGEDKIVFKPC